MEAHFTDIKLHLQKYLSTCDSALICTAWFSLTELINGLCDIELIVGHRPTPLVLHKLHETKTKVYMPYHVPSTVFVPGMMHHKFVVLRKAHEGKQEPFSVITGSYNLTQSAENNQENIVYIANKDIAVKYSEEFSRLLDKSVSI